MNSLTRSPFTIGALAALLAACSAGVVATPTATPTPMPTQTAQPTPTPAPTPTPTPRPSPTPEVVSWPAGLTAHPASGTRHGYLEYLPPGFATAPTRRPVLVYVGDTVSGGSGSEADLQRLLAEPGIPQMIAGGRWPEELPFVVLMPQYSEFDANAHCEFGDDLDAWLKYVAATYRIDRDRMYLTGVSCGAIGIWDYLATAEDSMVAAVVPIAGQLSAAQGRAGCGLAATPSWTFHGALDDLIPVDYVQSAIAELRACPDADPSELKFTVYPNADHDASRDERTYDGSAGYDIYSWLLEHTLQR